jgi:hypothetical protein
MALSADLLTHTFPYFNLELRQHCTEKHIEELLTLVPSLGRVKTGCDDSDESPKIAVAYILNSHLIADNNSAQHDCIEISITKAEHKVQTV